MCSGHELILNIYMKCLSKRITSCVIFRYRKEVSEARQGIPVGPPSKKRKIDVSYSIEYVERLHKNNCCRKWYECGKVRKVLSPALVLVHMDFFLFSVLTSPEIFPRKGPQIFYDFRLVCRNTISKLLWHLCFEHPESRT